MARTAKNLIDIDQLDEDELVVLNQRIIERLKLLRDLRIRATMAAFKIGDRVAFTASDGRVVTGLLIRSHRKSVTILTDKGQEWNVSPGLLSLVEEGAMLREAAEMLQPLKTLPDSRKRRS